MDHSELLHSLERIKSLIRALYSIALWAVMYHPTLLGVTNFGTYW